MFDYGKTESTLSAVACLPCGWEWKAELHQNSCLTALLGRYKSIHLKSHTVCWKLRTAVWRSALLQFELLHISDTLYRICFMYTCSLFPCHVMFGSTHPQKSKIHSSLLLNTLNTAQNVCSHIYSTQSLKPELFRQNITYESVCYYSDEDLTKTLQAWFESPSSWRTGVFIRSEEPQGCWLSWAQNSQQLQRVQYGPAGGGVRGKVDTR